MTELSPTERAMIDTGMVGRLREQRISTLDEIHAINGVPKNRRGQRTPRS